MARASEEKYTEHVSLRLTKQQLERLNALCGNKKRLHSKIIRILIDRALATVQE